MSLPQCRPKKYYRKTNLHNPSLNSYHVTGLFNPEVYNYMMERSLRDLERRKSHDALTAAQQQFQSQKKADRNIQISSSNNPRDSVVNQPDISPQSQHSRRLSDSNYSRPSPEPIKQQYFNETNRRLNFVNSNSIKMKQLHGYNILSNY